MISLKSMHYFMSFFDDFSRNYGVYTRRHKEEILYLFVEWKKHKETHKKGDQGIPFR